MMLIVQSVRNVFTIVEKLPDEKEGDERAYEDADGTKIRIIPFKKVTMILIEVYYED